VRSPSTENGEAPYGLLGKWAHALGFRRHFASKSRGYSVTLGQLRRARQRAQARIAEANRAGTPIDQRQLEAELLAEDADETTVVIGVLGLRRLRLGQRRRDGPGCRSRCPGS
jgi:hypothetical protein